MYYSMLMKENTIEVVVDSPGPDERRHSSTSYGIVVFTFLLAWHTNFSVGESKI
jgi:hypothetical protein